MKYNILGNTGLFVSEICLGAMTFGGKEGVWGMIGNLGQKEVDELVSFSIDHGINFFDTANVYGFGESEKLLGKALESKRKDIILATKVRGRMGQGHNQVGLSRVHIMQSVEDSLKRLNTDYIDLLQIHGFDPLTDFSDILKTLDDLVRSGKVRYIGCSNLAAWHIMKCMGISKYEGLEAFKSLQAFYSLAGRDLEREIVPVIKDQNLGLLVWSPLAGGFISGKFTRDSTDPDGRRAKFDFPPIDKEKAYDIIDVLLKIGKVKGVSAARVALKWVLTKKFVTSVIIGAKSREQLEDNIESTGLELFPEEIKELDDVSELTSEYPGWMIERQGSDRVVGGVKLLPKK